MSQVSTMSGDIDFNENGQVRFILIFTGLSLLIAKNKPVGGGGGPDTIA